MSVSTSVRVVNHLLDGLPRIDRARMLGQADPVNLTFGDILCQPDKPYRHVYFPLRGFISTVTTLRGHQPLEIRLIGNEGMLGATVALGINTTPLRAVVRGSGTALRLSAAHFRRNLRDSPRVARRLNRYLFVLMSQLTQTAGCNRFHEVAARLARWLLLTHDRAHANHFHLTHEFLADMLGVQRSGITIAAGALQRRKLIRYSRGKISILDRAGLEAASCECYQAARRDYSKIFV